MKRLKILFTCVARELDTDPTTASNDPSIARFRCPNRSVNIPTNKPEKDIQCMKDIRLKN